VRLKKIDFGGKPMHIALQINIILWIGIAFASLEIERLVALLN
jgi:hypothetical protein